MNQGNLGSTVHQREAGHRGAGGLSEGPCGHRVVCPQPPGPPRGSLGRGHPASSRAQLLMRLTVCYHLSQQN